MIPRVLPLSQELPLALRKCVVLALHFPVYEMEMGKKPDFVNCVSDSELDALRTLSPLSWGEDCALAFTSEEMETQ